MSTVAEMFDDEQEFEDLLSLAEDNAVSQWEMEFVESMRERYEEWGDRMYLSDRQDEVLRRIADQT